MPLYVYACPKCNTRVELIRKYDERDKEIGCNRCTTPDGLPVPLSRTDTAPASTFPGAASWRSR